MNEVRTLVAQVVAQFDVMRLAGLDAWDDGRSPLESGGKLFCGSANVDSPLGMAFAEKPTPLWAEVRKVFESECRGKLCTEWFDTNGEVDELDVWYRW